MTRIAVFCDGTWNSPSIPEPTHVHKLQQAVRHAPEAGQVSAYFRGIGSDERFDGPVQRFLAKYGGGAFGWGLDAKVKQAYQFIAEACRPGDEIYLFGFSRGAYTARSVAGMIRKCGLVEDRTTDGINRAYRLYRRGGARNHPDAPQIREQRRALSPRFATSTKDLDWRGDGSVLAKIAYVGVWDTVGARGLPLALLGPLAALWNSRYAFHDTALSSLVASARHAVALDETRVFYKPALWDNIDRLNGAAAEAADRPYQQVWFVGNHRIVGGSGDAQRLSAIPGAWILDGAADLDRNLGADYPPADPDPLERSADIDDGTGWFARWRAGPRSEYELHPTVRARLEGQVDYRPGSLRNLPRPA